MTKPVTMRPIGRVVGGRSEAVDDRWDTVTAVIALDPAEVDEGATDGLADFSHVEVVFCFDRVDEDAVCRGARHPRGAPTGRRWASWLSGPRTDPTGSGSPCAGWWAWVPAPSR